MRNLRLASKLLIAQLVILGVGALTLSITAYLVAPGLFSHHLAQLGDNSPMLRIHTHEAFISSMSRALIFAGIASLIATTLIGWVFVRRVADPIEQLANAADDLAARVYPVELPSGGFSREMRKLNDAFERMSSDLQLSEERRVNLLADLAHELRTPLATINAYIDGLEDGVVPASAESWTTLRLQISRLNRLVEDLKAASATDEHSMSMHFVPVDLDELIRSAMAIFEARCEVEAKQLRYNQSPETLMVKADLERFGQVFINLLDNACRHTSPSGIIEISVTDLGQEIAIEIADDGTGINQESLGRVFERFFREDLSRKVNNTGSGLGLTIARNIVQLHRGTIDATSPGRLGGATFVIVMPKLNPSTLMSRWPIL
jgi:two-component system sensor histidine kinase BaeS